jgi:predicted ATPase
MITRLRVRRFKGLREFGITPLRVNLLIGANGTGKTNFTDLIAFIASLCPRGLSATIKRDFGGLSQVRTRRPGAGTPYKLQIELWLGEDRSRGIQEVCYQFALAQSKEIKVQTESLEAAVYKRRPGRPVKRGIPLFDTEQPIRLHYRRKGTAVTEWSDALGPPISEFDDEQELVLASYGRLGELRTLSDYLSSWRVYNINARMAKQSTDGSDVELGRYGANIVPYVARLLRDEGMRNRLLDDLQEAVPYIRDVQPDRVLTFQTLRFTERDTGAEFQLPEMSDGTIRLLGLLAVLRQPVPPAVMVIEEPENAMHAYAIDHFVGVARRVAMDNEFASQVFFTSHSPAVVDAVLSAEAMRETDSQTACFVTQRKPGGPAIVQAPESVMRAIAQNLGRPSDFQREGSFGDEPTQLELPLETLEES